MVESGSSPTMETAQTRLPRRRRPRSLRPRPAWRRRPRGCILTPAGATLHCRRLRVPPPIRWRSAIGSFMARRATVPAADVMGRTLAAARSDLRSIQATGCGATEASRGSPRRSRTEWRSLSSIRASCRRWAGRPFRHGTWRRWRPTFGPSAMPGSHEGPMIARKAINGHE
jgi:hypothetical protein